MTTMSGQGACPNAAPVARLQAELEAVEGELVLVRSKLEHFAKWPMVDGIDCSPDNVREWIGHSSRMERERDTAIRERDEARALVPDSLVCW